MSSDSTVSDILFVVFIILSLLYSYLFVATLHSLRSQRTRQERLKTNRFLLRLRAETMDENGVGRGNGKAPVPNTLKKNVISSIIEALAHPLPFLAR
jgi:hypothetical protein